MYIARPASRSVVSCCRLHVTSSASLLSRHAEMSRAYSNKAWAWHLSGRPAITTGVPDRHTQRLVARRRFTVSSMAMHGHLTPPKPGEE